MIGGISSQVGFTDEKSDLFALRAPPDKGFDKAFERAAQARHDAQEPTRTASEPKQETRRRALYEEHADHPRADQKGKERAGASDSDDGKSDQVAERKEKTGKKLPGKSEDKPAQGEGRDTVQNRAPAVPPTEAQQAKLQPDGTVLLDPDAATDPELARRTALTAHLSGTGLVAYEQAAHGKGEQQAAEGAGLQLGAPAKRSASDNPEVAAQAVQPGELLVKVKPEEQLPTKSPREELPDLVNVAKPEDLVDAAGKNSPDGKVQANAEAKGDAARLALLNSMRQPPPNAHAAHATAFGLESGAALKDANGKGQGDGGARTMALTQPHGADSAQAATTLPNLVAPDRSALGALQRPDHNQPPTMERVAQEVRWMIRNDRHEATIRLEPDHLGSMRIKVVHTDGTLRIDMTVDNHQARSLIESRLSDLQQKLNLHDLGAEQFSFNVNVQDNGGWDSFKQPAQTARAMPYLPVSPEPAGVEHSTSAARSRPVWGHSGSGIYV